MMGGNYYGQKTRIIFRQNGLCTCCCRLCSRSWESLEVSLSGSKIWWRDLSASLFNTGCHIWFHSYDHRNCNRPQNRCQCYWCFPKLDKRFGFVGVLACIVPFIITPYYCVIGGWVIKYLFTFLTGKVSAAAGDEFFTGFISESVSPVVWFAIFILLTSAIVIFGVEKGVEKASRFMMPLLIVLIVGVCIFCITRPGAAEGVKYYLLPDFLNFLPQRCWLLWDNYFIPCLLPWVS